MPLTQFVSQILNSVVVLHRQPIVDCDGNLIYYEILSRFWHEGRMELPGEWVVHLEKHNMAPLLDRCVVRKILQHIKESGDAAKYSINLSAQTCNENGAFLEYFESELLESKVSPDQIGFEVTESVLLEDSALAHSTITYIRAQHDLSLDDMGAGYWAIHHIDRYMPHIAKIDGKYIRALPGEKALVDLEALISVSKVRKCKVVAEMIETEEQARICCSMGCDYLQGYWVGKPEALQ